MIEICILQCTCGCKAYAVSIDGQRVTASGAGPWRILLEQKIPKDELLQAMGVTGYD